MKDRILRIVESHRDEMLDFTGKLIEVPSVNPPGERYRECLEVIAAKTAEIGLENRWIEPPPDFDSRPRPCLVSTFGADGPFFYLHGHYDVVPASVEGQFQPHVTRHALFGRGSSDMKGGIAAAIFAVKALKEAGVRLRGRIGLVFVPDEETGGPGGARFLHRIGLLGKDGVGMLLAEPSSGVVWNANRGALSLRVTVKGKPAHVALQYMGENAFERMLVVARALLELKREVETRKTSYRLQPDAARQSILLVGGVCEGGSNFNAVPDRCSFTVDRRINPEEDLVTEKQRLFDLFASLERQGIPLEVDILQEGAPSGISQDIPLGKMLAESIAAVTGKEAVFEMCPGLLETRFYAQSGVPGFTYGPGILAVSHGPHEFVKLQRIFDCTAIYALTALAALQ